MNAAVQFALFCDIEDEACVRVVVVLGRVIETYPERVGVTFRHHAAEDHTRSPLAYRSVLAAARQGRGWDMLDMACANTDRLDDAGLRSMATQLRLDVGRFAADAVASDVTQVLDSDEQEAKNLKLETGPVMFVNGTRFGGVFTYDGLVAVLK